MVLKKVIKSWGDIARKKRLAVEILNGTDFPVSAGLWFVGSEFSRCTHIKKLPPPLDTAKQWGGWRSGKVLKFFVKCSEILIYPWFTRVKHEKKRTINADILLVNRLHAPVGFDLKERKVIRVMSNKEIELLKDSFTQLSKMYSCARFEIDKKTGFVIEEMITGTTFSKATEIERNTSLATFFCGLNKMENTELPIKEFHAWKDNSLSLLPRITDVKLNKDFVIQQLEHIFANAKTSWIHGDLFGENIIINNKNEAVVIDCDKYCIAPSFSEVMTLIVFEARTLNFDLMDNFFNGKYELEFNKLGVTSNNGNMVKSTSLFLAWLGWKITTEEFSEINLERFFNVLSRYSLKHPNDNR